MEDPSGHRHNGRQNLPFPPLAGPGFKYTILKEKSADCPTYKNLMKTIIMTAALAVLANAVYAAENPAFDQLKGSIPNIELSIAPVPRMEVSEAPTAPWSDPFDQPAFLQELAHALGETNVARAPWAMDDISRPQGKVLTAGEAQQLADRLRAGGEIPFNYIKDGCAARAHLVCGILRKEGVAGAKIFADSSSGSGAFRAHGELMVGDWPWHVAPLIYVREERTGKVDVRVLDLGLSRKPLPVAEWLGLFRNGATVTVDLTNDAQYSPRKDAGENKETFEANLPNARAAAADMERTLETGYLYGPGNTESAALGPFAAKISAALQKSLQADNVIQEAQYRPFFKNPAVTEVLAKPANGPRDAKLKAVYTLPAAAIAAGIVDSFGPDSADSENLLTDSVNLPDGVENITATAYGNQVIFYVFYQLPRP